MKYGLLLAVLLLCINVARCAVYNVKNAPFNAKGDGVTNDRPAFATAFSTLQAGDTLQVPAGTYRFILPGGALSITPGIVVAGAGSTTILSLESNDNTRYTEFFRPGGSNILITNLVIKRNGPFPTVMIPLSTGNNFTFRGVTIIGARDVYPADYVLCLRVGDGTLTNTLIESSTFTTCDYVLFQPSESTGLVSGFTVRNSIFYNNYATELEFNAPSSVMKQITVVGCQFSNNKDPGPSAGWAVGLANVQGAYIYNNTVTNYLESGFHIEDRCFNITIANNRLINTAQVGDNEIFIINDSDKVNVINNVIDSRKNTRDHYVILATGGGTTFPVPTNVVVSGNTIYAGSVSRIWYLQPGSTSVAPSGNKFQWEGELTTKTSTVTVIQNEDERASNGLFDKLLATSSGASVAYTIKEIPQGTYTVFVGTKKYTERGQFQLSINGANQASVQDQYGQPQFVSLNLGTKALSGDTTFKFTVTGKNSQSSGYSLVVDYILLAQ